MELLGASWDHLERFGVPWKHLGSTWGRLGRLGGVLDASWCSLVVVLGRSGTLLGRSWGALGALLGALGAHLAKKLKKLTFVGLNLGPTMEPKINKNPC